LFIIDPAATALFRFPAAPSGIMTGFLSDLRTKVLLKGYSVTNEWEDAVRRGSIDQLQRLVASGADIDARDGYGQTALMLAAREGQAKVVEWLVDHGAALDHTAKYGLSALMLAVIGGRSDAVGILAAAGANLCLHGTGAPGFTAKTALDLAIARGDPDMVEILRTHAARRRK
jgi:ankyrin repeat protein